MDNIISFISIGFLALIPLINPVGAVPVFCTLTANDSIEYRKSMALKSSIYVACILVTFLFIGKILLEFFGISLGVLEIAGGLIVANAAWEMVTSKQQMTETEDAESKDKNDISFTPMALPMLSGPGAIGAVIGLSTKAAGFEDYAGFVIGIILIATVTYICLLLAIPLFKVLGKTGVGVLNRIMGFFILAIAVHLIVSGITDIIKTQQ